MGPMSLEVERHSSSQMKSYGATTGSASTR